MKNKNGWSLARLSKNLGFSPKTSESTLTWTSQDRDKIAAAVDAAESNSGLQMIVYVGDLKDDPRAKVAQMLADQGFENPASVLFLVDPGERKVEVVTSEMAMGRVTNSDCDRAIEKMVPFFREGQVADGLVAGIETVAEIAGPGVESGEELPDMLD